MALLNPYVGLRRPGVGAGVAADEGTVFDFEADPVHASIGLSVDMPMPRSYLGPGGLAAVAAVNSWPLEYDGAGSPLGRRVMTVHKAVDGGYGVYNAVTFDNLSWLTPTGTLLIGVTPLDVTSRFARVLELSDGTAANRIGVLRSGVDCLVRVEQGNSQVVRLNAGPLVARQYNKIALSYASDAWRVSVNGGDEVVANVDAVPSVTEGHIGGLRGIASNMLMHNLRHWDHVHSNLKGLSGL